jgi:hypothetical protein
MSLRNRLVLPVIFSAFAILAGCGGGTNTPVPPPTGGFSDTNFNGTYTFSISGSDILASSNPSPFVMAGTVTACGCSAGTISAGTVDLSDLSGPGAGIAINTTGSGYTVTADGRGKLTLSIPSTTGNFAVVLDFILSSSSHGLIMRFDSGSSGSGTIDLQPAPVTLSNAYAFALSGGYSSSTSTTPPPLALAGAFTVDSSGIVTGVEDVNQNGTASTQLPLTGSITVGTGTAPGAATLTSSFGTIVFDVYAIDATHLKLVESDAQAVLAGDLFSQPSAAVPTGNLVFTMAGLDSGGNPFVAGGIVGAAGGLLTSGLEDVNDAGTVDGGTTTPAAFTGSYSNVPSGSGRFALALTGFTGGINFAAYPTSGGVLLLEVDTGLGAGVTAGSAMAQTSGATGLAASQGYGMNLTGVDLVNGGVPLDQIAQFNTTSTSLTGLIDENDFTVSNPGTTNLTGSYTAAGSSGSGTLTLNSANESAFYYPVDGTTSLAISSDSNEVSVGALQTQATPTSAQAAVTARHLSMLRSVPRPHAALGKNRRRSAN